MQRREFLSTCLAGAAGGLPLVAPCNGPDAMRAGRDLDEESIAAQYEQLSLRTEELLAQTHFLIAALAEADRYRAQMLTLVHTMRSPLACIQIRTDAMRDDARHGMSDELCRELFMTVRNCELLTELVNEVFALEKTLAFKADASRRTA